MSTINQKEYLKRYLSSGSDVSKKKKKRKGMIATGVKIIDDDIDNAVVNVDEEDPFTANEDAPQIVSIIDDRPPSLRIDEETKNKLWKPIGVAEDNSKSSIEKVNINKFTIGTKASQNRSLIEKTEHSTKNMKIALEELPSHTSDLSPRRRRNLGETLNVIETKTYSSGPDSSPPRRKHSEESGDLSPPRKYKSKRKHHDNSNINSDDSKLNRESDEDLSPPRPRKMEDDLSQIRIKKSTDKLVLGRLKKRSVNEDPPLIQSRMTSEDITLEQKSIPEKSRIKSEDLSPPRPRKAYEDLSPEQKGNLSKFLNKFADLSPSRPRKVSRDSSQERGNKSKYSSESKEWSPPQVRRVLKNVSPKRRSKKDNSPECSSRESYDGQKLKKTLDGKTAGLQFAKDLHKELKLLKDETDRRFDELDENALGKNARTIVRDRKTGRVKDLQKEACKSEQQQKLDEETKEKYSRWGKGVKQVEEREKRAEDMIKEMNKPLARYADDEDLEKYLKEQEREEDPMLNYIRSKKKKKFVDQGIPEKPEYMGEFMPNRYGIKPGYRWDGVDRSNGFEKRLFEVTNEKSARLEEALRWSTEDM